MRMTVQSMLELMNEIEGSYSDYANAWLGFKSRLLNRLSNATSQGFHSHPDPVVQQALEKSSQAMFEYTRIILDRMSGIEQGY